MAGRLHSRRVAVLATDGVEQVELLEPAKALKQSGAQVEIVSNKAKWTISSVRTQAISWVEDHLIS